VSDPKQRMEALQRANQVRMKGSHWKMELRAKPRAEAVEDVCGLLLLEPMDEVLGAMQVGQVLRSIRGVAETKSAALLVAAGIVSGMKPIRALTARQRWALAGALAAMGDRAREDVAA
jgi:hypothetical protein